jgi:hypothetical protein
MNFFGIMLLFVLPDFLYNFLIIKEIINSFLNCRSVDCFRLGWPMRINSEFFSVPLPHAQRGNNKDEVWHIMA